ncbi:MAG: hypothetical protein ACR2O1_01095, partial [Boseongicola sp.]
MVAAQPLAPAALLSGAQTFRPRRYAATEAVIRELLQRAFQTLYPLCGRSSRSLQGGTKRLVERLLCGTKQK